MIENFISKSKLVMIFAIMFCVLSKVNSYAICDNEHNTILTNTTQIIPKHSTPKKEIQRVELKGKVVDEDNIPIAGATINILRTRRFTSSDRDGYFVLRGGLIEGRTIYISFMGMKPVRVKYTGQKTIKVVMKEDAFAMKEARVVGKTNINEIDLRAKSGVVEEVKMERIIEKPMFDMGLALQGSITGLCIINVGELGVKPKIRIRGNSSFRKGDKTNEPLYVMDGQIISPDTFYNLNPIDIEGIKVLKDVAACALYGIKAANGVIEVKSKRGHKGKLRLAYSMNVGITAKGRRGVPLMKTAEKLELENRLQHVDAPGYRYSKDFYMKYHRYDADLEEKIAEGQKVLDELLKVDTDWFNELLRMNMYQRHNLSLRGGTEETSYYISSSMSTQGGRMPGNNSNRLGLRLNLDQKILKKGYLMISVNGAYSRIMTPNGTTHDPTELIYRLNPYEKKTGKLYSYPNKTFSDLINQYEAQTKIKDAGITASVNITPFEGFDIMSVSGLDLSLKESYQFTPSTSYSETHSGVNEYERGIYAKDKNSEINITNNIRLTYNKLFKDIHDLTLSANMDYYRYQYDMVSVKGYGVGIINSPAAVNQSIEGYRKPSFSSPRDKTAQLGFGLVAGYSYKYIYDLYATLKSDASSVLPESRRWNYAWAIGAGINFHKYKFLEENEILTKLNLKGSFGWMANLNGVSAAQTVGTFSFGMEPYENVRPLYLITLYNKDLRAEQTNSTDIVLSTEFIKKIRLDLNYYNRVVDDALLDVPIPTSSGYASLIRNIGSLRNRGIEARISGTILDSYKARLNLAASLSYNDNKVLFLYDGDEMFTSTESIIPEYRVGYPYDMLYGAKALGINPFNGYPDFLLPNNTVKNATEELLRKDVNKLGHSTPPFNGAFNFSFSYGNFDIDADFYYVFGGVQRMNYSYVRDRDHVLFNAVSGQLERQWFNKGDTGKIYWNPYFASTRGSENLILYPNSMTVQPSDYLRFSMLSFRYRVSQKFLDRFCPFIKYANFAFQGSNLFTLTSYKESDPESGKMAGTLQPIYTINVNLTF